MTLDAIGELNWLAVLVAGVAYFALGATWYQPMVLGRIWMRAIGLDPAAVTPGQNAVAYAVTLVGYLVAAVATALLARATASDSLGEGLVLGLVVGIGYKAAIFLATAPFDVNRPQPWLLAVLNSAYHVIGLVIVAEIVSVWQ